MKRLILPFLLAVGAVPCPGQGVAPSACRVAEIPSPAGPGSRSAVLAATAERAVWLAWLEPAGSDPAKGQVSALRCAEFDLAAGRWRQARTIATGPGLGGEGENLPAITADDQGRLAAVWPVRAPDPVLEMSHSEDHGATWSPPVALSRESRASGCAALATLADGRVLAAWIDGRTGADGKPGAGLYLRFLRGPLSGAPDWLLDAAAVQGCAPALAPLLDGGALIAYRGLADGGARDIRVARLQGRRWEDRHVLSPDNWIPPERPDEGLIGGPAIDADGGRVIASWFTGADGDPRVLVSTSPDAGARFLMPLRLGTGRAPGRPAPAILHDGAALLVWLEASPAGAGQQAVLLCRATPDFKLEPPLPLGAAAPAAAFGPPRIALARDYTGDPAAVQAIVAFTAPGSAEGPAPAAGVRTVLVSVREAALLAAAEADCRCGLTTQQLLGYPVSGVVAAVSQEFGTVIMDTEAVPGVMGAGRHVFFSGRDQLRAFQAGRTYIARVERHYSAWWIYDPKLLLEEPR